MATRWGSTVYFIISRCDISCKHVLQVTVCSHGNALCNSFCTLQTTKTTFWTRFDEEAKDDEMEELSENKNATSHDKTQLDMYSSTPNREDEITLTATEDVAIIAGNGRSEMADVENGPMGYKEGHDDNKKPDRNGKQELVTTDQGNLKNMHVHINTCRSTWLESSAVHSPVTVDPRLGNERIQLIKIASKNHLHNGITDMFTSLLKETSLKHHTCYKYFFIM